MEYGIDKQKQKFPEDARSRPSWPINSDERITLRTLALGHALLVLPVTFRYTTACRSLARPFTASIDYAINHCVPCSANLRQSPSSRPAAVHWLAVIMKTLRSSWKDPIHSFSYPPTEPAPPSSSPDIIHFSAVLCLPYVPQIPRTGSASCAKSQCLICPSRKAYINWVWRSTLAMVSY